MKSVVLYPGRQSLNALVESKLVELNLVTAKIRRYLTVSETLGLAKMLIKDTSLEKNSNRRRSHLTRTSRKEIQF